MATPPPIKKEYLWSIDIESEGDDFNNPIIAIGTCFGPADGSWPRNELIRFRGNLKPLPGQVPEQKCMDEFWSKNQDVYQEIKQGERPAEEVMTKLLLHAQQLVAHYEDGTGIQGEEAYLGRIKLVTDCPDFDLGRLHVLGRLQTNTWTGSIRHMGTPKRRGKVDPGERLDERDLWDQCEEWIKKNHEGVVHDHRYYY